MLLIGLDAASQPENFGYAIGTLGEGAVKISEVGVLRSKREPDALAHIIVPVLRSAEQALIAIDAPLGWPSELARLLARHQAGANIEGEKSALFSRETDKVVTSEIGKKPLEVGADKIARAAHSALAVLGRLRSSTARAIPLAWEPKFAGLAAIEVYPGATLKARGLDDSGYKERDDKQKAVRRRIARGLHAEIPALATLIDEQADLFDACLCLVAAKDFLEVEMLRPRNIELAHREGWIWVRART